VRGDAVEELLMARFRPLFSTWVMMADMSEDRALMDAVCPDAFSIASQTLEYWFLESLSIFP
jgi:hypothetical protein